MAALLLVSQDLSRVFAEQFRESLASFSASPSASPSRSPMNPSGRTTSITIPSTPNASTVDDSSNPILPSREVMEGFVAKANAASNTSALARHKGAT